MIVERRGVNVVNPQAERVAHAYGTCAKDWLGSARSQKDLGQDFGATLTEAEVRYLMDTEWAETAEDVVWRRSKLGLKMSTSEVAHLAIWMKDRHSAVMSRQKQTRSAP